jgi:hypothetical protein
MSSRIGKTFIFGGMALAGAVQQGIAATLAGFTFESLGSAATTAASVGPLAAEVGTGSAFGQHASAATVFSTPAGNGSIRSLSSNTWATGGNYEFRVPSTGFQDLQASFDQTRSGTGPNEFNFQYSTDGSSFTTFATYTLAGTSFSTGTAITAAGVNFAFDLSAVDSLENLSNVYFRLTSTGLNSSGGTSLATAGTSRVDNFFITATEIPEPTGMALVTVAGAAALARRRRQD